MLKGISISLIALSLMVGTQVYASDLESDLSDISFKDLCKGKDGSTALGDKVWSEAQAIISGAKTNISTLNATLRANSNNEGAKALLAALKIRFAALEDLSSKIDTDWSEGCNQ